MKFVFFSALALCGIALTVQSESLVSSSDSPFNSFVTDYFTQSDTPFTTPEDDYTISDSWTESDTWTQSDYTFGPTSDYYYVPIPKNKFTVVASNNLRQGKPYKVLVRGLDITDPTTVNIRLSSDSYNVLQTVILNSTTLKAEITFDTSSASTSWNFYLTVSSGDYSETKTVAFIAKKFSVFVQTNKAIFKPLDLIQYRIFAIDSESNAFDPQGLVTISLIDPRNNKMLELDDITFSNGKHEGQFQLPSKPILGTWQLTVRYGEDGLTASKSLTVGEYTLSLFTASLSVPSQVAYSSSQFPVTINAEYTFKQPVSGFAAVSFYSYYGSVTKNVSCDSPSTTFYINFVQELNFGYSGYYSVQVSMEFIDPRTNTKAEGTGEVLIVPYSTILEFVNENTYRPGQPIKYTLVSKTVERKPAPNVRVSLNINNEKSTVTTGRDGTYKGTIKTSSSQSLYYYMLASCSQCSNVYSNAYAVGTKPYEGISLLLLTKNPSHKRKVFILATLAEEIKYFYIFVSSKGVLLESRKIYLMSDGDPDNNPYTVEFPIFPNFTYAPDMKIYAYYYDKSNVKFRNANLYVPFKQELPNYLKMQLKGADSSGNAVVTPASNVSLTIQSKRQSIVSLAAVDQRVLQLANTQSFTFGEVMSSFNGYSRSVYDGWSYYNSDYYQSNGAGLNFFTNIPIPRSPYYNEGAPQASSMEFSSMESSQESSAEDSQGGAGTPPRGNQKVVNVRKDFREVFLFEDISIDTDPKIISRKVPESITTYLIYGISMNKNEGMGLPDILPSATIFLPFFIQCELPPAIKRGESFIMTIQVFNYLPKAQTATLSVAKDAKFEAVNPTGSGWTSTSSQFTRQISIPSRGEFAANFTIKAISTGVVTFKITARSATAGDAVEKPLRVIPEGVPRSIATSTLIAVDSKNPAADQTLKCVLPASAYNDTAEISSTVIGDVLGKALNNLENLITMPGGCGEQTMLGFVPDYAVLEYLTATNKLTPALRAKLLQYLTAGYQNQLNYQRYDGSFSAFGNSDPSGSTWLSAYVALFFKMASAHIAINSDVIQNALYFIINQQNANGSFNEPGRVIHTDMQGASGSGIALTAYVTTVLTAVADTYPFVLPARSMAIQYLEQELSSVSSTYDLAVITAALQFGGSPSSPAAFNTFYNLRIETATEIKWAVPAPASTSYYYGPRSLDIEVTAYGLMLLVYRNYGLATSLKAVKYLTSQSNAFGGYSSSQDTVMALSALSIFAMAYTMGQSTVSLQLTPNAGSAFSAQVSGSNALTLQTFTLNSAARQLNVHVNNGSTGVAIVSLVCNFYEDPTKVVPSYNFTYNFDGSCQWRLQMQICPRLISGDSPNMAIMEVRMPSGYYYYDAWWLRSDTEIVSKTETYEDNTIVVFYFNRVSSDGSSCVTFGAGKSYNIVGLKPGSIVINDYYDTSKQGSTSFSIPSNAQSAACRYYY